MSNNMKVFGAHEKKTPFTSAAPIRVLSTALSLWSEIENLPLQKLPMPIQPAWTHTLQWPNIDQHLSTAATSNAKADDAEAQTQIWDSTVHISGLTSL